MMIWGGGLDRGCKVENVWYSVRGWWEDKRVRGDDNLMWCVVAAAVGKSVRGSESG